MVVFLTRGLVCGGVLAVLGACQSASERPADRAPQTGTSRQPGTTTQSGTTPAPRRPDAVRASGAARSIAEDLRVAGRGHPDEGDAARSIPVASEPPPLELSPGVRWIREHSAGRTRSTPAPGMVHHPGGRFRMGLGIDDLSALVERMGEGVLPHLAPMVPEHEVEVGEFWLDARELSNGQYLAYLEANQLEADADLNALNWSYWLDGQRLTGIPPGAQGRPLAGVSQHQAEHCALWMGRRLPTELEWEYAARAELQPGQQVPWRAQGFDFGQQEADSWQRVPGDVSPRGVFDLCASVAEWTASDWDVYPNFFMEAVDLRKGAEPGNPDFAVVRGGSWLGNFATNQTSYRFGWHQDSTAQAIGFRTALSAVADVARLRAALRDFPGGEQLLRRIQPGSEGFVARFVQFGAELVDDSSWIELALLDLRPGTQAPSGDQGFALSLDPVAVLHLNCGARSPEFAAGTYTLHLAGGPDGLRAVLRDAAEGLAAELPLELGTETLSTPRLRTERVVEDGAESDRVVLSFPVLGPQGRLRMARCVMDFPEGSFAAR